MKWVVTFFTNSFMLIERGCAQFLLHNGKTAQVCDATGDAMKDYCRATKYSSVV